jgi:tRNA threonylcarbamoyladenosine biosynthesis protein TsaE
VIVTTRSPAATRAFARRLARVLRAGDVVGLIGDLGSGKTTFVQGLAAGLGIGKEARVRSPSFTVANVYEGGRLPLYHLDFFRHDDHDEIAALGYEEYVFGEGVCAIEWLDRIPAAAPRDYLAIRFEEKGPTERALVLTAHGARAEEVVRSLTTRAR